MAIIRELITRLGFTVDDAEARRYERRLRNLGRRIRGFGRTLSLFVTAPIVALGGSFIKAAADAEETDSKFKEVFSSIRDEADATAKALAKDFDLANVSAQEMLSSTGDILIGFGFTETAALDLSKQVNALAVDIASFKNVQGGAAQASNAITKALLGEREMLKGIGIAILEEDVKLKIAQLTTEGMTFATNRQAKSFATLQLVIDRSTKAIGDYARTSGSTTNQARKMRQRFIELSVTFGKVLLPAATELLKMMTGLLEWLNSFSPGARRLIIIIAGITAALGPLLIVVGTIVTLVASLPLLIAAAIAAVGALGFLIGEDIAAFIQGRKSVFGLLLDAVKRAFGFILGEATSVIEKIMAFLIMKWTDFKKRFIDPIIEAWDRLLRDLGLARQSTPEMAVAGAGRRAQVEEFARVFGSEAAAPAAFGATGEMLRLERFRSREARPIAGATINAELTINLPPGTSASDINMVSAEEITRLVQEAESKRAITQRLAP